MNQFGQTMEQLQSLVEPLHFFSGSDKASLLSVCIIITLIFCSLSKVAAREKSLLPAACRPELNRSGTVIRISAPNSMILDDGSEVMLVGVLMPTALDVPAKTKTWLPAKEAAKTLAGLIEGQSLRFAFTGQRRDRYGRQQGHAFLSKADKVIWVQSKLIELGQARVAPENLSRACALELLKREDQARSERIGIWRHVAYAVRPANRPWHLLRYRGSYQIVEGMVQDVAQRPTKVFINFGRNKRKDFTAGIYGRLARTAHIYGQPMTVLKGRRIRIRGWITWRGGPFIHIRNLAQISVDIPAAVGDR